LSCETIVFLTGEKISSAKAKEIGFLTEVAENEKELDALTAKYVEMLLLGGPKSMSFIKETVNHHVGNIHEINKEYSMKLFDSGVVTKSDEALFGIKSFIQNPSKNVNWNEFYTQQESQGISKL